MRSSLSCGYCRRSKIKCAHSGTAPCQKRSKLKIRDCVLTTPHNKTQRSIRPGQSVQTSAPGTANEADALVLPDASATVHTRDRAWVDSHLSNLTAETVLNILNAFTNKHPELAILNHSAFIKDCQSPIRAETKTLLSAVLALSRSHLSLMNLPWVHSLLPGEHYAAYAREMLADKSFQSPNTHISQALLVMALYEWGSREFHRAWIYISVGIAIRIMQALNSHRIAPYPLEPSPPAERDAVSVAVENRTFWACFIMERMISSGAYSPPMLPMSEMANLGGYTSIERCRVGGIGQEFTRRCEGTAPLDITRSFEVLVTGFDIWTDVMAFVLNDGRRAPGMCTANNCPWVPESTWGKTRQRLETWRANQHHRLRYPENTVVAHKTLGFGESFTYLNLLYYLSTLMLHREYFPFLPTAVSVPRGPVDQPTLEAEAPEGWWDTSALELFFAAEQIANLLHDASQCGANMLTPFIGFCAFSAAYMNLYIYRFPHMNLNRSLQASTSLEYCRAYLEDFRHVWKLGESWMTTINHASILYQRAASDKSRYQGKSREDFNVLHQSIHEFRVVDRSDQHIRETEGADVDFASPSNTTPAANVEPDLDLDGPLSNLLNEASTNAYEQGMWSHWWPSLDEINLPSFRDAEA
ncbi:hypothetical protein IFM46972_09054 [Aspergillus udagawae]|uniref:Xylanolytic transcriptional activator regulatory domain-containing protein n=1 Tax=Aspergillus udagawae TaxID=91492 RepID=A0A8H3PC71_9EURO|nr:hypothetical protein IFM46972_09054 [Aspergillus udagawae]